MFRRVARLNGRGQLPRGRLVRCARRHPEIRRLAAFWSLCAQTAQGTIGRSSVGSACAAALPVRLAMAMMSSPTRVRAAQVRKMPRCPKAVREPTR